jgi:acetyltransferase
VGHAPITADVPGVEESREKRNSRGPSQPQSFSKVTVNGLFRRDLNEEARIIPPVASAMCVSSRVARISVQSFEVTEDRMNPPSDQAYPVQYVSSLQLTNGMQISIRPIRPEDEAAMARFHESLSDRSVYLRYFHMEKLSSRVAHSRLARRCFIDYDTEMALIAEYFNREEGRSDLIAVGRLIRASGEKEAEVALIVSDKFQKCGVGAELMRRLIQVGRDEKLERIVATVLPENMGMRVLASHHGFKPVKSEDLSSIQLALDLHEPTI